LRFDNGGVRLVFRRMSANPFLDPAFHIRWSALAPHLVAPAIEAALERAKTAVDAIAARELDALSYENTFLELERSTEQLNLAWSKVTHLQSVADAPALRDAHNTMLPKVSAFYASIPLNAALWMRLKTFAATPAGRALTGISRRFLDETVADRASAGYAEVFRKRPRRYECLAARRHR
jgi:oligopeptidase A